MRALFDPDGVLYQTLSVIAQLVTVSLLCLLCCIPVVTAGAAFAASAKVMQNLIRQEGNGTAKPFFRAFRENLKQGIAVWLIQLVLLALLAASGYVTLGYLSGTRQSVILVALVLLAIFCLATPAIAYQLMARYDNSLMAHIKNAFALTLARFPRALIMTLLRLLPVAVLLVSVQVFLYCLPLWFLLLPGLVSCLDARLLNPVFRLLEGEPDKSE